MTIEEAKTLLYHNDIGITGTGNWLELGAGSGTFTNALADCLDVGSRILAVDQDKNALALIPALRNQVTINKTVADFRDLVLTGNHYDGILMANSLHYVKDQEKFLRLVNASLKPGGKICLVEYDTTSANRWVPYPIQAAAVTAIFKGLGLSNTVFINRRPSVYQRADIYSALATG